MKYLSSIFVASVLGASAAMAQSVPLFTHGDRDDGATTTNAGSRVSMGFTADGGDQTSNQTLAADLTPPSDLTQFVYAGFSRWAGQAGIFSFSPRFETQASSSPDRIQYQAPILGGVGGSHTGIAFAPKSIFDTGSGTTLSFAADSVISFNFIFSLFYSSLNHSVIVQNGDTFYLWDNVSTGSININPTAENWRVIDPVNQSLENITLAPFFTGGLVNFDDVRGVGIIFQGEGDGAGNALHAYNNFNITGVVPEPSTYAAIFGVLALAAALIRRKLRK